MAPPMKPSREEMLAVTMNQKLAKQGAKTRKLAEARDVNTMPDPKTYAAVMGMLGTPPNEMGFSAMHPQYKEIMDVAAPAYYAGIAAQLAPLVKPAAAGVKAAGKMAGQAMNDRLLSGQSLTPGFNTPAPIMFAAEPGKAAGKTGPFFSALDEAAANLPRSKGTGKEFMTELRKQPNIKKAEIDDRKLAEIEAAPKMTKDEFLAMLKDRPAPIVNEKVIEEMGGVTPEIESKAYRLLYDSARNNIRRNNPHIRPELIEEKAQKLGDWWVAEGELPYYIDAAAQEMGVTLDRAQFKDYTLPGGKNYREVLLTLPTKKGDIRVVNQDGDIVAEGFSNEASARQYIQDQRSQSGFSFNSLSVESDPMGAAYQSRHWDDPNVLAHMRVSDRRGPNGEKILHVEEIQSDWHQEGRKKGYKMAPSSRHLELQKKIDNGDFTPDDVVELDALRNIEGALDDGNLVPDAPFKKNWHELATKKAMDMAVEGGYDKVVITPGKEQADRFNLRKHINDLQYDSQTKELSAWDHLGRKVVYKSGVTEDQLPQYIGKEATTKLLAQNPHDTHIKQLFGADLEVGGEGMRGFYDQILPAYINKEYGKYGAEVGTTPIVTKPKKIEQAKSYFYEVPEETVNVHSIDITPEMREAIKSKGQPLYQAIGAGTAGAAATDFDPEAYDKGGEVKATPVKNKQALGMSKALQAVHGFASKPFGYNNPPGEMISEFLGIPATARTLERMGYGEPLTTGKGMTTKPREDTMEALMSVAPLASATKGLPVGAVVKPKGGNWLKGNVEQTVAPFKSRGAGEADRAWFEQRAAQNPEEYRRAMETIPQTEAINKWIDRNLTNYIKNEMGTEGDPIRKLAEQGILHKDPELLLNEVTPSSAEQYRQLVGGRQMGQSDLAKAWENASDTSIEPIGIEQFSEGAFFQNMAEPWMKNAPEGTRIYSPMNEEIATRLGFDHIVDVLKEDLAAGRIRPEQLSKVSMEQAVRRTFEYDQEMAKKMREAAIKQTEGMPVHKEYPEGYKWIELKANKDLPSTDDGFGNMSSPGYDELEKALKYEGDTMGHCVGGYCDDVYEGRSRIYSLRDAKGEPHVTVEIEPKTRGTKERTDWFAKQPKDVQNKITTEALELEKTYPDALTSWHKAYKTIVDKYMGEDLPRITQIKGKQNRAPKEEYLPYVQDFVRGGQWSDVRDLQNTGLFNVQGRYFTEPELTEVAKKYGRMGVQNTPWEVARQRHIDAGISEEEALRNWVEGFKEGRGNLELPSEGMKRGGEVKMGIGGLLGKGAIAPRLARAPAKTPQEIEAIAERMAPQVLGQYVRESEKSAKTVAGKTKKQFEREKTLPVDIRANKEQRKIDPIDFEKFKENVVIGVPGDPTVTAKTLHGVGDVTLESAAPQHGGPLYGLYSDDANFWASGIGPATRVQNLALEAQQQYDMPVLGKYIMMGSDSSNYAQHFADANLQAIDLSRMSKAQIEKFNQLVRRGSIKSGPRPSFPGIEDKDSAYLHMAIDPELRKHFNALMQQPTVTEPLNMPSGIDIRFAITEPELRNLEIGSSGYSIGRMRPDIRPEGLKLSEHPTYSHDIPGQFMGGTKYPVPYELSFPDTVKAVRENPTQAPQEFGSLKMVGPRQVIDQQFIDEMKKYEEHMKKLTGKKKGGAVQTKSGLLKVKRKK